MLGAPENGGDGHSALRESSRRLAPTIAQIVNPDTSGDWWKQPETWEGNGSHDVTVSVNGYGADASAYTTADLRLRMIYDHNAPGGVLRWLDLKLGGCGNANGSDEFDETIANVSPQALLAFAEAFRRLIPLARAHGLIPAEPGPA